MSIHNSSYWLGILMFETSMKKLKQDVMYKFENTSLFIGYVELVILI